MKVLNLKPTKGVSRENFIFRGIMELSIWDLGGQQLYMDRYFSEKQRELVFSEVMTAVFMVDSAANEPRLKEIFDNFMKYIFEFSPGIEIVYVLLNKIDLQESKENTIYELLIKDLTDDLKSKIAFTPVSVKEGSAQHRLIEILDYKIQQNTMALQRLGKIRHLLDQLKLTTLSEYFLFNQPDGLLVASTLGKPELVKFQFLRFEIGSLDSNIYQIYTEIMNLSNSAISPLELSIVMYETDNNYILVKEISNGSVLMIVTKNKSPEVFNTIIGAVNSQEYKDLKNFLNKQDS
jgi:GTPase SAR1 family protein